MWPDSNLEFKQIQNSIQTQLKIYIRMLMSKMVQFQKLRGKI